MIIIDDILLLPLKGVVWLADRIKEQAEGKLYNVTALKESLQELQRRLEDGVINEKEYDVLEARLLKAIEEAQKYHKTKKEAGLEQ